MPVAYRIKGNGARSNTVANNLPVDHPPPTLGVGSKSHNRTFSEHGHFACKLKGIVNAATYKHIIYSSTLEIGKVKTFFF